MNTDITFVCVRTPSKEDGSIDLRYVKSARTSMEDKTYQSYPVYGFANLYFVNKNEGFQFNLLYKNQKLFNIGRYTTLFAWTILFFIITVPKVLSGKVLKKVLIKLQKSLKCKGFMQRGKNYVSIEKVW